MSGLELAGLVLALPGLVELCLKYRISLIKHCEDYATAEKQVNESILRIESISYTMNMQMDLLRALWDELPDDLQRHESSMLAVLQTKIQTAVTKIDGLIVSHQKHASLGSIKNKYGKTHKAKYASVGKQALEEVINDLEAWQMTFNRSFMMITMVRSSSAERSISKAAQDKSSAMAQMQSMKAAQQPPPPTTTPKAPIFMSPTELRDVSDGAIPFSEALTSTRRSLEERVLIDQAPRSMSKLKVRDLAHKFAGMDPSITYLLQCQGVVEIPDTQSSSPEFQLIFSIPSDCTSIRTLRSALLDGHASHSLTSRIRLATSLARSIIFLHEARFVHKNIRPETILLFASDSPKDGALGTPYLIGFEELRDEDAETSMRGDNLRERNIYRHPQRQGLCPQERYNVRHDIYSLGVCLLEIGLWDSFVGYGDPGAKTSSDAQIRPEYTGQKPFELKRQLVATAERKLPGRMGDIYTDVVVACLTCLDADSETFGDLQGLEDEDGIIVGVRYIEKILEKIERIVV